MKRSFMIFLLVCLFLLQINTITAFEWESCGLDSEYINTILIDPRDNGIIFTGSGSNFSEGTYGKLLRSKDGGTTWDTLLTHVDPLDVVMHPDSSNILYVALATANFTEPGIVKSIDGGATWFKSDSGITLDGKKIVNVIAINKKYPDTLYAATGGIFGGSFYMSYNGGASWTDIADLDNIGLDIGRFQGGINKIVIDPESTNVVYLGTHWYGDVLKSKDFGRSWQFTGLTEQTSIWNLLINPMNHKTIYASSIDGFFKTKDGGINWIDINNELEKPFRVLDMTFNPMNDSELYLSSWQYDRAIGGIFKSMDDGETWKHLDSTFAQDKMRAMAITPDGTHLLLGGSGFYKTSLITGIKANRSKTANSFKLFQNYPNPFNHITTISYELLSVGDVKVKIYNLRGEKIKTLVDRHQVKGSYKIKWDARDGRDVNIVSGVYILKFSVDAYTRTLKLMYLK